MLFLKKFTGPDDRFALDLARYAPPDWDGRLWFSVLGYSLAPARRLKVELAKSEAAGQATLGASDLAALTRKKEVTVPRLQGEVTDQLLTEKGARLDNFALVTSGTRPTSSTEAYLGYTSQGLHFLVLLYTDKQKLETAFSKRENRVWMDDSAEILISPDLDQSYFHFIANSEGARYTGYNEPSKMPLERPLEGGWDLKSSPLAGGRWQLRVFVPFSLLRATPKTGDRWALNVCRHEAAQGYFREAELSTWSFCPSGSFVKLEEFGVMVFQ
jgi:hypothetical protein